MGKISKFTRVLVEGDTTDGRKVTAQDIQDIAETYDPATYGARVNLEHVRGTVPGGPFDMLGDVLAVKAQQDDINIGGQPQKRWALYAQIDALPALVKLASDRQKIYFSCEIQRNFASTGRTGLVGLASTDSPANLAMQQLNFSSRRFTALEEGKTDAPELGMNLSAMHEAVLEFTDAAPTAPEDFGLDLTKLAGALKTALGLSDQTAASVATSPVAAAAATAPVAAAAVAGQSGAAAAPATFSSGLVAFATSDAGAALISAALATANSFSATLATLSKAQTDTTAQITELAAKLDNAPAPNAFTRTPHNGQQQPAAFTTDC